MGEILCDTCNFSVGRGESQFCLCRDLFTRTAATKCGCYARGEPMGEDEYEAVNDEWLARLGDR